MGILYIVGDSPGAGSTAVCTALASIWRANSKRVALIKPLELAGNTPGSDARLFGSIVPGSAMDTLVLGDGPIDQHLNDSILAHIESLSSEVDVVLIEGLPLSNSVGEKVPAAAVLGQAIGKLGGKVIGVLPYSREFGPEECEPWREAFQSSLIGVLINRCTRYGKRDATTRLAPAIVQAGMKVLGIIPEDRVLFAPTVRQVADHLSAEFVACASEDQRLVEQFMIGGLILEWGGNYFGRYPRQAVIVKGARMDIAMSALNFPMSCLILTACTEPPQYVYQRAEAQDVPLLVTKRGTLEVATLLEAIHEQTSIHHIAKVAHLAKVLRGVIDWDFINIAAGLQ